MILLLVLYTVTLTVADNKNATATDSGGIITLSTIGSTLEVGARIRKNHPPATDIIEFHTSPIAA